MKQEMMGGSGSDISWTICKSSAPHSRQITKQFFTGRMLFLPPNCGKALKADITKQNKY